MQKINSKPQEINQSLKNPHLLSSSHRKPPTPSITTPTSTTPTPTPAPPSNQTIDQDIQEIFRNTRMLMQQANDTIQQTQEVIQNINNDNGNIRQTTDSNSNSNLNNIDGEAMDSSNDTPMATEVNDTEDLETIKLENNESEIPKSNNNMSANSANNTSNNTNSNNNNTKNNCKSDQKWLGDGHKLFK
ncbi:unnamed protein product [[Candida] boidinii]|nr:unnamed protein product [[Candida] boidinii]